MSPKDTASSDMSGVTGTFTPGRIAVIGAIRGGYVISRRK
jgi:hypothetical protein